MKKTSFLLATLLLIGGCSTNQQTKTSEATVVPTVPAEKSEMMESYPMELKVKDYQGNEVMVKIEKEPSKVVTTSVSSTEMLLELGLKDKIVGIMKPDNKIEGKFVKDFEDLNVLGDKKTMSKEVVVAQNSDIMIGRAVLFSGKGLPTIEESESLGIPVIPQMASVNQNQPTLETSLEDFLTYAKIFNLSEKAQEISKPLEEKIKKTDEFVNSKNPETKKVLAMTNFSGETFGSFNVSAGVPGDIMKRLHLEGYKTESGAALTLENLISMNPDIIIYVKATRNAKNDETAIMKLKENTGLSEVNAIKNNQVIEIGYDDLMDFGLRSIDTYESLANTIYGN